MYTKKIFYCLFCILTGCNLNVQGQNNLLGLPLEISDSPGTQNDLVIYLTGDGGWNNFSQHLVNSLEKKGYGVVTINARDYFWNQKSPEKFTSDIEELSKYYLKHWDKKKIIFIGYSFGADVVSFLPVRLSTFLQNKIKNLILLSPSASTDFVIRLRDLIGSHDNLDKEYKTAPEIQKSGLPIICVFGKQEDLILKKILKEDKHLTIYQIPGDHEYEENYLLLTSLIYEN